MSDGYFNELDGELEEDRVSLEKLGKRVTVLETDLPELFEERLATLRNHLNVTIDTLNDVVKIINDQIIAREPADGENPDFDEVDHHHYLDEVYPDTQPTNHLVSSSPHPEPY